MTTAWIGVDPGSLRTGVVLRLGGDLLAHRVIERATQETVIGPGPNYWDDIDYAIATMLGASVRGGHGAPRLAVEGVNPPSPFIGGKPHIAKPIDLMALAATFGAILARRPAALVVPPAGNGRGVLAAYPEQLVTAAERRLGLNREAGSNSAVSHCRSAWDVSLVAQRTLRGAA